MSKRLVAVITILAGCLFAFCGGSLAQDNDLALRSTLAAERSAAAAEWQADLTAFQAALSVVGSIALLYTLYLTLKSLRSTEEASRQQRQLFVADQRPWVSVRAELVHLGYGRDDLVIKVRFTMRNSGKTPALHTWLASEFSPHHHGQAIWDKQREFTGRIHAAYKERLAERSPVLGFSILPGDERTHEQVYTRPREDIPGRWTASGRWRRQPHIIGCATYTSGPLSTTHQTLFILEFFQDGEEGAAVVDLNPEFSPFRNVVVRPYFVGDHAT